MTTLPMTLDELTAALVPKIGQELRRRTGDVAPDKAAEERALDTADMLLASYIAELKATLKTRRAEAQHLRQIVAGSELGSRARNLLAEHRGQ